jgi:alpha-galactosidase
MKRPPPRRSWWHVNGIAAQSSNPRRLIAALAALVAAAALVVTMPTATPARAADNGAALTPQMGWSSWSFVRKGPTEATIEAQAKAMHDSGLVAHGYGYLNIDDFFYLNPATTVDAYGRWVIDTSKFPHGMSAVGDYVHGQGEKFGMYLTPGISVAAYQQNTPIEGTAFHARDIVSNTTGYEANYNFGNGAMYFIDYAKNPAAAQAFLNSWANQLASWGVDYIKLDGVGDGDIGDVQHWSQALRQTGRTIHFELSNSLDLANGALWRQYSNGWRVDGDIECYCSSTSFPLTNWNNIAARFTDAPAWAKYAGAGGWNDLDSVELGNGSNDGLTQDERQTQMTLWAASAAPLVLGSDLTHLDAYDVGLLTNDEVIATDQRGHAARPVDRTTQQQVWATPNGDGSYTVALFNLSNSASTVKANWVDVGFGGTATARDLWSHTDLGSFPNSFSATLAPHASRLLRVTPAAGSHYTGLHYAIVNSATGKYLDVTGGSTADGAGIAQSSAGTSASQRWQLTSTGDGYYKIVNVGSGKVLDVPGATTTSGTQLVQSADNSRADAQWRVNTAGSGAYTFAARSDGQNADVAGASTADGAPVVQSSAGSATSQQWRLVPDPDPNTTYRLVNASSGGRLDVDNDSTANGAKIVQWQDNGRTDQQWYVRSAGNGYDTVTNVNSGKLLNIPGPTTTNGTQLIQFSDDGGANSRWQLVDAGPNQIQLKSQYDSQVVDETNNSLANGAAIIQWPANNGDNQRWILTPTA